MRHFERDGLIWHSGLDTECTIILLCLNQYLGSNQSAWPSMETIGRDTRLARRTIARRLKDMESKGVLSVDRRFTQGMKTSNQYVINWNALGVLSITANENLTKANEIGCDSQAQPENQGCSLNPNNLGCDSRAQPENRMCQGVTYDVTVSHIDVTVSHLRCDCESHRTDPDRTNPKRSNPEDLDPEENLKISSVDAYIAESQAIATNETRLDLKSAEPIQPEPEQQSLLTTEPEPEKTPTSQKKSKSRAKSSGNSTKKEKELAFIEAYNRLKPPVWPKVTSMVGADRGKWMAIFEGHYGGSPAEIESALDVIFRGVAADKWARTTNLKVSFLFTKSRYQDFYDIGQTLADTPQYERALQLVNDPKAMELELDWQRVQQYEEQQQAWRVANGY